VKFIVIAQNKEYFESKGFSENLSKTLFEYLQGEDIKVNKKLRKHLVKQISKNKNKVVENERKILENPETIKRLFPLVEDGAVQKMVKNHNVSESAAKHAISLNEEFAIWIAKMIDKRSIIPEEDDNQVIETLEEFKKIKNSPNVPDEYKDINRYETYGDLAESIDNLSGKKSKRQEVRDITSTSVKTVYEEDGVKVLEISSPEAMTHYAKDTKWCVEDITWARKYIREDGGPYHLVFIDEERKVLIHEGSHQIKDPYDRPLSDAVIIARIAPALNSIGIRSGYGDFSYYRKTLKDMEETNERIKSEHGYKKLFEKILRKDPEKHYLLYGENRKDPELSQATLEGYLKTVRGPINEIKNGIDSMPEEFFLLIPENLKNSWKMAYEEEILEYEDPWEITNVPQRIIAILNPKILDRSINKIEEEIKKDQKEYNKVTPDLRNRLSKETIEIVKNFWISEIETTDDMASVINGEEIPEYFLWNKGFLNKIIPIIERRMVGDIHQRYLAGQYIQMPEHIAEELNEEITEEIKDNILYELGEIGKDSWEITRVYDSGVSNKTLYYPDEHLERIFDSEIDKVKNYLERNDLEGLRMDLWEKFLREYPDSYDSIQHEDEDLSLRDAASEGWRNAIWNYPWEASSVDEEFFDYSEEGDQSFLADAYVNYFEKNPSKIQEFSTIDGFHDKEWLDNIAYRLLKSIEDINVPILIEEYFDEMKEDVPEEFSQLSHKQLKSQFKNFLIKGWESELQSTEEKYKKDIQEGLTNSLKSMNFDQIKKEIQEILNNGIHEEEISILEKLIKRISELSNDRYHWGSPPKSMGIESWEEIKIENILEKLSRREMQGMENVITQMLEARSVQEGNWYFRTPMYPTVIPEDSIQEHSSVYKTHYKPWYELIMNKKDMLQNPLSSEDQKTKELILKECPKEVLDMPEIQEIITGTPFHLTSWYKYYKIITSCRKK